MTAFFTADLHLLHERVIQYSNRPFKNKDHMTEELVGAWNRTVSSSDTTYVLGDVALGNSSATANILRRLNGTKRLIAGNHDARSMESQEFLTCFQSVGSLDTIKIADQSAPSGFQLVVLCHYPMVVWDRSHYGTWQLHGHCHGSLPDDRSTLRLDVGIDFAAQKLGEYRPWSYDEIKQHMSKKKWIPVDRHRPRE